jgi:arylsulfatase A-like enzyme
MTGRYPFHTGLQHTTTITPGSTAKIPTDIPTAAEVFRKAGYHTLAVGKWHLGYSKWDYTPTGRGFDSYTGYMQGETDYYNKTVRIGGYDFWQNRTFFAAAVGDIRTKTKYSMEQYMSAATDFLDVHSGSDKPLFIYFAHQVCVCTAV